MDSSSVKSPSKWEEMSHDQLVDFVKKLLLIQKKLKNQIKESEHTEADSKPCVEQPARVESSCQTNNKLSQDDSTDSGVDQLLEDETSAVNRADVLNAKVNLLSDQLRAAKHEIAQKSIAIMELEDYRNLVQDLHGQIKSLRIEIEKQTESAASVNEKCHSLLEEKDNLLDETNKYKSTNESLIYQLECSKSENAQLKDQLLAHSRRDKESLEHIEDLTVEISYLKDKLERIEEKSNEERARWKRDISERCERISELEDSLETRVAELKEIKMAFDNTLQEHACYKKKVAEALRKSSNGDASDFKCSQDIRQKLEDSEKQLKYLEKQLSDATLKISEQQERISKLNQCAEMQRLSFENEIHCLKMDFVERERKLNEQLCQSKNEIVNLQNINQELLDNSKKIIDENSNKKETINSLQLELKSALSRAEEMSAKSERLGKALDILRENSTAKFALNRDDDSKTQSYRPQTQLGIILGTDYSRPPRKILFDDSEEGRIRDIAEVEEENMLIKELCMTLKLELSRFEANEKRRVLLENGEYLKNVLLKFLSTNDREERTILVPVIAKLLVLNEEETEQIRSSLLGSWWSRK